MHKKIILGPSRNNTPQMVEGAVKSAMNPGQIVKLDNGELKKATTGFHGLFAVLMPNTLFGGDIRDPIAGSSGDPMWGVAVIMEETTDYAVRVKGPTTGSSAVTYKSGYLLKVGEEGELEHTTTEAEAVCVLREDAVMPVGGHLLLAVRKL